MMRPQMDYFDAAFDSEPGWVTFHSQRADAIELNRRLIVQRAGV